MNGTKLFCICLVLALVCFGVAAVPDVNPPTPAKTDLKSIPLADHMMRPPGTWLTAYGDQPIEKVTYTWNFAALIAKVNAQIKEIDDLKARVVVLEQALKPVENPTEVSK